MIIVIIKIKICLIGNNNNNRHIVKIVIVNINKINMLINHLFLNNKLIIIINRMLCDNKILIRNKWVKWDRISLNNNIINKLGIRKKVNMEYSSNNRSCQFMLINKNNK